MGKLIMGDTQLYEHMRNYQGDSIGEYYTNVMIKKYSKEKQDKFLEDIYEIILNVPGGYWQIVENMDYMPEFEYHKWRNVLSYEKENVPKTVARRELTIKQYGRLYD